MQAGRTRVVLGVAVVLLCAAAFAYVRATANVFRMPVAAMEPTIKTGESVRVDMKAYETTDPQRWDLVVFHPPRTEVVSKKLDKDQLWVFRVVGLPGEAVSFDGDKLLIDEQPIEMPEHLRNISYSGPPSGDSSLNHPFVVPPASYYVLGDNSAKANDSRYWGAVPRANIVGKVKDR